MAVGLPGTGIGGLYYITLALALPVRTALRNPGDRRQWRRAFVIAGLGLGMVGGMWLTGWVLGQIVIPSVSQAMGVRPTPGQPPGNLFRWLAVFASYLSLTFVLGLVQVVRLAVQGIPTPQRRIVPGWVERLDRLTPTGLDRISGSHASPALDGG